MLVNPGFKPTKSFPLDKRLIPMMNMFYHPSGYFGFSSFNLQKNLATFINKDGEIIDSLAIPNKIYPDIWEDAGPSDNAIILHYNTFHKKYVVASRFKNNIAVIDEHGNPDFQLKGDPVESKSYFRTFYSVVSDRDFIYCIYSGEVTLIYDIELQLGIPQYPNRVLVFDWNGVGRYDISLDHPVVFCALDSDRKRLIVSSEDFDNCLVTYDVSGLY